MTLESMDKILEYWEAMQLARLHRRLNKPTKRQVKNKRKGFMANAREAQAESMLNMARPAGHRTLPRFPSEKEKILFAAHARRRESGWIRG